jgi:glycerol-3-phosphate dehydrogenase (NAD+)
MVPLTAEFDKGSGNGYSSPSAEERLEEIRKLLNKSEGDALRVVGIGAGAWGSVFIALLQEAFGSMREKIHVRIWRRPGKALDRASAETLFEVINGREDVLRRLIRKCAYLKYVEARLGDRILYADEILRDGFCINMLDTPLCPLKVVTNLQEAVWDADIVINGLPSTETRPVFEEIGRYWKERRSDPVIISLAKGVETSLSPVPHITTPTQMIHEASKFFPPLLLVWSNLPSRFRSATWHHLFPNSDVVYVNGIVSSLTPMLCMWMGSAVS